MQIEEDNRITDIYKLLLEMAKGNFFYRIELSDKNDEIEALKITLNMVNEEICASFNNQVLVPVYSNKRCVLQMSVLMNKDGVIEMINNETTRVLMRSSHELIGKSLTDFLSLEFVKVWDKKLRKLIQKERAETIFKLEFLALGGLSVMADCSLAVLKNKTGECSKILLNTIFFTKRESLGSRLNKKRKVHSNNSKKLKVILSPQDVQSIVALREFILCNLEKDLPNLKDLALRIGTNEFKLKYGFKELYGTTVFRFLTKERLRQAKSMIIQSRYSLKQIAAKNGFKSNTHFSRAFKEEYGFPPNVLRKWNT